MAPAKIANKKKMMKSKRAKMIKKKEKRKKIKNIMLSTLKMTREIGISSLSKWTIMRRNTNLKWKKIRENSLLRSKFRYC